MNYTDIFCNVSKWLNKNWEIKPKCTFPEEKRFSSLYLSLIIHMPTNIACPHFSSLVICILNSKTTNIGASTLKNIAIICLQMFAWCVVWKLHMSWQGQQGFSDGAAVLVKLGSTSSSLSSPSQSETAHPHPVSMPCTTSEGLTVERMQLVNTGSRQSCVGQFQSEDLVPY